MNTKAQHLLVDFIFLGVSIALAGVLVISGTASRGVLFLGNLHWIGIFISGFFFTSAFTTAPAMALLGTFAQHVPVPIVALIGGMGAVLGDYIIFRLVKDRLAGDLTFVMSLSPRHRFVALFKKRPFRFLVPFVGGLIIASPLPDEIGVAMIGLSRVKSKYFFMLSFVFNVLGILMIGLVAQSVSSL